MKVVLLCGGAGKRMAPIVQNKALLRFAGKPLIIHQIAAAMETGLDQFVIVANRDNISDLKSAVAGLRNVEADFTIQEKPLGMADALLSASDLLADEPLIVVSCDDIIAASTYAQIIAEYQKGADYFSYITAYQVPNYFSGGYLVLDQGNEIRHIVEKPPPGEQPSNLINIVVHLHAHPRKLLDFLTRAESAADDAYEQALERIIQDGHRVKAVLYGGTWQTIKYPWHILDAMDYYLKPLEQQIAPSAQISDKAVIDGKVVVEGNVRVLEGAIVRGSTHIGYNSIIGNGVLIRNSDIGDNCVIGYNTEIKHSHIGDRCWFHSNYIGDSVVEDDCTFGAGTVTANFRFDEANIKLKVGDQEVDSRRNKLGTLMGKGSHTGINVSLMPGIRVGSHSYVGAHVCLTSDLRSDRIALAESNYKVLTSRISQDEDKRQELFKRLAS